MFLNFPYGYTKLLNKIVVINNLEYRVRAI